MAEERPPGWRIILGFFVAPIVSGFALACYAPLYAGLPDMRERIIQSALDYGILGGYPTALIFGTLAYRWLRRRVKPSLMNCTLAGGAVAAAPWLILTILPSPATEEQIGPHLTVVNHFRTVWGWIEGMEFVAEIGAVGLIGGLCFWLVAVAGWRPKPATAG